MFIDKTWIKTNMAPLRGWGPRGKRLRGFAPHGHWRTLTFLPPYSPDLNPIEQAFAKIKHWMRIARKRTIEDTWRHIGHLVSTIRPTECANYITNAGYASVKA